MTLEDARDNAKFWDVPMEAFYWFCVKSDKSPAVMLGEPVWNTTAEGTDYIEMPSSWPLSNDKYLLLDDAIRDFQAMYEAERLTGTLPGMEVTA